jgi:hypothetical protein
MTRRARRNLHRFTGETTMATPGKRTSMPRKHETGETQNMFRDDIRNVERSLSGAYAGLQRAEEAKKFATEEHKEAQVRLNGLVAELVRMLDGEQPLPLGESE